MAFRVAACQGFEQGFVQANPVILEPIMLVEVETPNEFVGRVQGDLSSRRGLLLGSETMQGYSVIRCEVPLDILPICDRFLQEWQVFRWSLPNIAKFPQAFNNN